MIRARKVYTPEEIRKKITPVLKKNNVRKAVLFGPYATNEANPNSCVDLFFDYAERPKGWAYWGVYGEIQERLNRYIHIVEPDNKQVYLREAKEIADTGIVLYENKS
ncbi:MAG: nucleotidyltransferase domain-containing protein [Oscillospiraceae bacterium]|jgi:predicted nucleotidyltransferase|nr:nucleotidyltransferase domain-containing protein [Oscillospiraceae bacterium]